MEPGATRSDRRRARIEAVALAALAALPLLPYFLYLAKVGIPRFAFTGDYAGLELATRLVTTGKTLLGPYSRFGFSHPGPLYFYVMAPIYALWGSTSTGLFAAACSVNVGAAMVTVAAVRLATTRAHAIAVTVVILAWLAAYGNACVLPWNPLVVVLPLVAFLVLAALTARGALNLAPLAVFFGALVAETHLSTVPTVLGVALATAAAVVVQIRRGKRLERTDKKHLVVAAIVLVVALAPPLVEQMSAHEGNISKLVHFFANRKEPLKPFGDALRDWTFATSWLPDRLLEGSLLHEADPAVMRSEAAPATLSVTSFRLTIALLVFSAAAAALARRRRDTVSLALLAVGAFSSILAVFALRAIIGANYIYLVFWTTAGSTLLWMGVATTLASALGDLTERARTATLRIAAAVAILVGLAAASASTSMQRGWLAKNTLSPPPYVPMRDVYGTLVAHLAKTGETPVIHAQGAWHIGMSFLLEMSKDHIPTTTVERDRWILGRQIPTAEGIAHPLHVYARTASHPLDNAACLNSLATSGDVELLTSDVDVTTCDASPSR